MIAEMWHIIAHIIVFMLSTFFSWFLTSRFGLVLFPKQPPSPWILRMLPFIFAIITIPFILLIIPFYSNHILKQVIITFLYSFPFGIWLAIMDISITPFLFLKDPLKDAHQHLTTMSRPGRGVAGKCKKCEKNGSYKINKIFLCEEHVMEREEAINNALLNLMILIDYEKIEGGGSDGNTL